VPRAPLLATGVISCAVASCTTSEDITPSSSLIQAHAPDQNPPADSGLGLFQRVFAGCRQSLLGDSPSRHYLCNPCVGAWTPTPQCPPGAFARFFPGDNGLTSDVTGSAHQTTPAMQLQHGILFRGCSHSLMFRLLRSLDPQVAPTAVP
jgi:hypothetical protein